MLACEVADDYELEIEEYVAGIADPGPFDDVEDDPLEADDGRDECPRAA